jgi:hypothetical protein
MALASTSRPKRSAPIGSVSALTTSSVLNLAARSSHSLYLGANGSIADKSTFGPFGTSIAPIASGG